MTSQTVPFRCRELTQTLTGIMLALVRERAVNGTVALQDVERIAELLSRGTMALDNALVAHESRCRQHFARPKGNVGARSNPFHRLMVRPFEQLLAGDPPPFSRVHLPNYFSFLDKVLGSGREEFERQCRAIVQALLVVHGNALTWEHFYADPRTVKTLATALGLIASFLATPQGVLFWRECMMQPVDGQRPAEEVVDDIRALLLETNGGLSAPGR